MKTERILYIIDLLIKDRNQLASEMEIDQYDMSGSLSRKARGLNIHSGAIIKSIVNTDSDFYSGFINTTKQRANHLSIMRGTEILKNLKMFVSNGLVENLQTLISKEFFTKVSETAKDLLDKGYKDNAAVQIGIALEQRIQNLCKKNGITIEKPSKISTNFISTSTLNTELVKAGVYDKTIQKHITAWLGIRNSAAHGRTTEFDEEQVSLMITGVTDFLDKYPI